jgi:hypothetical protein
MYYISIESSGKWAEAKQRSFKKEKQDDTRT